jgi:anti-sigma factor RsiW
VNDTTDKRACEECRAAIAADPATDSLCEHLAGCPACRAWQVEMRALNARIARALAVAVPAVKTPALDDTAILAETRAAERPRSARSPGAWFALAASVLVAVFLGVRLMNGGVPDEPLGQQVLAHIDHEAFSLTVTDRGVGSERLARIVPASVAVLGPDTPLVTYAQSCEINGHPVPHLVVQGEHGPVTILLMQYEQVDGPQHIGDGILTGVILPVGKGSIAIVGRDASDLDALEQTMKKAVAWQT